MNKRYAILEDIKTLFGSINTPNGFLTNMGAYTTLWNNRTQSEDQTYFVDIRDNENSFNFEDGYSEALQLSIKLAYKSDSVTNEQVYHELTKMLHDAKRIFYFIHTGQVPEEWLDQDDEIIIDQDGNNINLIKNKYFQNKYGFAVARPVSETINIEMVNEWMGVAELTVEVIHSVNNKWILDEVNY